MAIYPSKDQRRKRGETRDTLTNSSLRLGGHYPLQQLQQRRSGSERYRSERRGRESTNRRVRTRQELRSMSRSKDVKACRIAITLEVQIAVVRSRREREKRTRPTSSNQSIQKRNSVDWILFFSLRLSLTLQQDCLDRLLLRTRSALFPPSRSRSPRSNPSPSSPSKTPFLTYLHQIRIQLDAR